MCCSISGTSLERQVLLPGFNLQGQSTESPESARPAMVASDWPADQPSFPVSTASTSRWGNDVLVVPDMIGAIALVARALRAIAEIKLGVGQLGLATDAATMPGLVSPRRVAAIRGFHHLAATVPGSARDIPAEEYQTRISQIGMRIANDVYT